MTLTSLRAMAYDKRTKTLDSIHYTIRTISILGNAIWPERCSSNIPTLDIHNPAGSAELLSGADR